VHFRVPYTSVYYAYLTVGWLVSGSRQKVGLHWQSVNCGPMHVCVCMGMFVGIIDREEGGLEQ